MNKSEFPFILEDIQEHYCVTCKHHISFDQNFYILGKTIMVPGDHRCYKDSVVLTRIDPVTGPVVSKGIVYSCRDQRDEVSHIENKCGPEGRFWELREEKK